MGPPPQKRGNGWKWALGAVALLAVIGVTAAITISVTGDDGGNGAPTSPTASEIASANDTGPATIITEDPTCDAWAPIISTLSKMQQKGWVNRDTSIPAANWTPEQRAQYNEVGQALRSAADQTVPLIKLTPHRVVRELYEQFVAYAHAYSETIPTYVSRDNHLASVAGASANALVNLCDAIEYDSAQSRAPLVDVPPPPATLAEPADPNNPGRFVTTTDPTCTEWFRLLDDFRADTSAWQTLDSAIPASEWTAEQRATIDAVAPVMEEFAERIDKLSSGSDNPTLQDFAALASQYRRAYVNALPSYTPADSYLSSVSSYATSIIYSACKAAEE